MKLTPKWFRKKNISIEPPSLGGGPGVRPQDPDMHPLPIGQKPLPIVGGRFNGEPSQPVPPITNGQPPNVAGGGLGTRYLGGPLHGGEAGKPLADQKPGSAVGGPNVSGSTNNPEETVKYWTEERMRDAKPDNMGISGGGGLGTRFLGKPPSADNHGIIMDGHGVHQLETLNADIKPGLTPGPGYPNASSPDQKPDMLISADKPYLSPNNGPGVSDGGNIGEPGQPVPPITSSPQRDSGGGGLPGDDVGTPKQPLPPVLVGGGLPGDDVGVPKQPLPPIVGGGVGPDGIPVTAGGSYVAGYVKPVGHGVTGHGHHQPGPGYVTGGGPTDPLGLKQSEDTGAENPLGGLSGDPRNKGKV